MPQTREQIKRAPVAQGWISPHYADGGWHATPGVPEAFDPRDLEPKGDRILVELLPPKSKYESIVLPESVQLNEPSRYARVIRTGTGVRILPNGKKRRCCCVKAQDVVIIGLHHDWQSQDGRYVIAQEEDVRVILRGEIDSFSAQENSH